MNLEKGSAMCRPFFVENPVTGQDGPTVCSIWSTASTTFWGGDLSKGEVKLCQKNHLMKTPIRLGLSALFILGLLPLQSTAQSPIVITEVHYNPCSEQGSDGAFEFVEILNVSDVAISLEGYAFSGAFSHAFATYSLEPGSYLVVASDASSYAPEGIPVVEWTSGSINNTGETIFIHDTDGNLLDEVTYSSSAPWPDANGTCFSLELSDPGLDNNLPESWCASSWFGSPGLPSACDAIIPGCTDAAACNFDPAATIDDGGCQYPGLIADCDGQCINDSDADGICDELEELNLSMICGAGTAWDALTGRCVASDGCPYDLTGDSTSSTNDILILLSHFGEVCEP